MGNKKYIMCSGLAFADEEDMEMLHEYAKEGWIFERLRFGVLYELQRKQPQNRIYSYDSNAVKKKDKDDYLAMFEESGWHLVGQWSRDIRFFWAEAGTPALHSDAKVLGNQYRGLFLGKRCLCGSGSYLLSVWWLKGVALCTGWCSFRGRWLVNDCLLSAYER